MYRIQADDQKCHILDTEDRVVFGGSFRECEEWLDQREQLQQLADRRARHPAGRIARLWSWFGQLLGRNAPGQRTEIATVAVSSKSSGRSRQ